MALLNPPGILPTAMWAVVRLLAAAPGPMPVEQARALLSPPALEDAGDHSMFKLALGALSDLELVQIGDGAIQLIEQPSEAAVADFRAFAALLRTDVLAPNRNTGLLGGDQVGPRDLTRALVWFLAQDPMQPLTWDSVQQRQAGAFSAEVGVPFSNDTRWNAFTFWSRALGLASEPLLYDGSGMRQLAPDPTPAVRHCLSAWPIGARIPVGEAIEGIRADLPVLPGGRYAGELGHSHDPHRLDAATSWALLCGHDQEWIRLERRADAAQSMLLIAPGKTGETRLVTEISILEDIVG
jgi:hypothetical protein